MGRQRKKIISVLLIVVFLLGSGTGQLIHAAFHDHSSINVEQTNTVIGSQRSYCAALQLMLPDFSESGIATVPGKIVAPSSVFSHFEISIPHCDSFKTSDRAPPVLA